MSGIQDAGRAPLFLIELCHEARTTLANANVLERPEAEIRNIMSRLVVETDADVAIKGMHRTFIWKWHQNGCEGPEPLQPSGALGVDMGVYADDWPLPTELGIEESPGCIFALVALNDFAAKNSAMFHRNGHPFTAVFSDAGDRAEFIFFLYWTQCVDGFQPEHETRLRVVVQRAIEHLAATTNCDGVNAEKRRQTTWRNVHLLLDQIVGGGDSWGPKEKRDWVEKYNRDYKKVAGFTTLSSKKLGDIIRGRRKAKAKEKD